MDVVCAAPSDYTPEESSCFCRPAYHFEGIQLEHATLGLAQLLKAAYLLSWLQVMRRNAVAKKPNSLFVLPVYAKFLTFEAWSCVVWGAFFLVQSFYEIAGDTLPRLAAVVLQLARYGSAFTWALCCEGVFLFLCFASAGAESLHAAIRIGALWASLLVTGCAVLWLRWAGCSTPPEHPVLQLFWVGAWVPFWMRLVLMLPLYSLATAYLLLAVNNPTKREVAWERGALPLAIFELITSATFLFPKLFFGVFTTDALKWQISDAIGVPLAWIAYTPFLTWILLRDSLYWSRSGFTACLMGDAAAGTNQAPPHRVPLLTTRGGPSGSGTVPRFIIVDASALRLGRRIGQGSSSIVSSATLFGEPVAVKQMEVSRLTREFATMFLTEAECLSHCRHPNIVRFVGGCIAPPLVCLVMEFCESSVHRLIHPKRSAASGNLALGPLPETLICPLLRGIISGMAFLHEVMGIAHGDLKPLNMLIHRNEVKLCDFGSSQLLQHELTELAFSATLPYMAPELLTQGNIQHQSISQAVSPLPPRTPDAATSSSSGTPGSGSDGTPRSQLSSLTLSSSLGPGHAVDVYSFGVCLWEMCERVYPWHELLEAGMVDELKKRVGRRAERLDSTRCPYAFRLLVEACWRQAAHQRPSFRTLQEIDLVGIERGSLTAVRAMREKLWPNGVPKWAAGAEEEATEPGGSITASRESSHQSVSSISGPGTERLSVLSSPTCESDF